MSFRDEFGNEYLELLPFPDHVLAALEKYTRPLPDIWDWYAPTQEEG